MSSLNTFWSSGIVNSPLPPVRVREAGLGAEISASTSAVPPPGAVARMFCVARVGGAAKSVIRSSRLTGTSSPEEVPASPAGSAVGSFVQLHARQAAQSRYIGFFFILGFVAYISRTQRIKAASCLFRVATL